MGGQATLNRRRLVQICANSSGFVKTTTDLRKVTQILGISKKAEQSEANPCEEANFLRTRMWPEILVILVTIYVLLL